MISATLYNYYDESNIIKLEQTEFILFSEESTPNDNDVILKPEIIQQ